MSTYAGQSQAELTARNQAGFTGDPIGRYRDIQALAAAGTGHSSAGQINVASGGLVVVSAADDTKGVRLPVPDADGFEVRVKSTVASKILNVYPQVGASINGGTAATGGTTIGVFALASGKLTTDLVWDATNTTWWTLPLLPS